jgi:hypothetical protein
VPADRTNAMDILWKGLIGGSIVTALIVGVETR